jgi:hypothetical protein
VRKGYVVTWLNGDTQRYAQSPLPHSTTDLQSARVFPKLQEALVMYEMQKGLDGVSDIAIVVVHEAPRWVLVTE